MKQRLSITLATAGIFTIFTFSNCSKNLQNDSIGAKNLTQSSTLSSVRGFASEDRIDSIMKGISTDNYSLSFDKAIPVAGITRTAYGTDNFYAVSSSNDLRFTAPSGTHLEKVVFWNKPTFTVRTCPKMIWDLSKLKQVFEVAKAGDPGQFKGVSPIPFIAGGGILASEEIVTKFAKLKADRVDAITKDLDPEKFVILGAPDADNGGVFTRDFYGYADLNAIVFRKYKTNLKDFFKPTLKGCFDPRTLQILQDKLITINPALYKGLTVKPYELDKNIATLGF